MPGGREVAMDSVSGAIFVGTSDVTGPASFRVAAFVRRRQLGSNGRRLLCQFRPCPLQWRFVSPQLRACSAVGSAPEWHSGGHRFDPGQVHHPPLMNVGGGCRAVASQSDAKAGLAASERATARQAMALCSRRTPLNSHTHRESCKQLPRLGSQRLPSVRRVLIVSACLVFQCCGTDVAFAFGCPKTSDSSTC